MPSLPLARGGFCEMEGRVMTPGLDRQRQREGVIFLVLFALTIPAANWFIGHVGTACVAPNGPCVVAGCSGTDGALRRHHGRRRAGAARSRAAPARRRHVGFGDPARDRPFGVACAAIAHSRFRRRLSALGVGGPCGLHSAGATAIGCRRYCVEPCRARGRTRSYFCGSPSDRSNSCSDRSWARRGWCCCQYRSWPGCGGATNGSASRRLNSF